MSGASARDQIWTIGQLLHWTKGYFEKHQLESARLDAEILLAHVLDCKRIDLYVMFDEEVAPADRARFRELVLQRASACPVAYLVGKREFYSLEFEVTPDVLIPRPETELVIAAALEFASDAPAPRFLDIGVGSGALAVTLAKQWPASRAVAVDVSAAALAVARRNAELHDVADRIALFKSDLFENVPSDLPFDLIVSNPPYVAEEAIKTLAATVRDFEPRIALDGGALGLAVIRRLIAEAPRFLRPGGRLLMEIGADQDASVRKLLASSIELEAKSTVKDYAGLPRVIVADRRSSDEAAANR